MIYFDPTKHRYYNEEKIIYDSPTKIINRYKNKFDAITASKAYAKKHGNTPEYWREQWKKKSTVALSRGHEIHSDREDEIYGRGVEVIKRLARPVRNGALYNTQNLLKLPDGVYPEMNIWNDGWKIAGRPDQFFIETIDGIRYVDMLDYKTNRKIDKVSYQDEQGNYRMMKKPLEHLMDTPWIHYGLQMSLYQYILETHGFTARSQEIIHIPHPEDLLGVKVQPKDVHYKTPYFKNEVVALLHDYNKKRKTEKYE